MVPIVDSCALSETLFILTCGGMLTFTQEFEVLYMYIVHIYDSFFITVSCPKSTAIDSVPSEYLEVIFWRSVK